MHVQTDGPEKTNDADVTIAAHAICVRTTMLSLASVSEFPTFTNYKISITLLFFQNVVERRCHSDAMPFRLQI